MSALEHHDEDIPEAHAFRLRLLVERMVDDGFDESEIVAAVNDAQVDDPGVTP